jgi:hypothetical protein
MHIVCRGAPLSCVLLSVFRRDLYFVDGVLVTCVQVVSVYGLIGLCR